MTPLLPDLSPARWIWYPSGRCLANTFVLFRRELDLPSEPVSARGWIAAESRYRLEANGARVQWGPAPCDPRWAEADPVDLTATLRAGRNVLGATVLFYGHGDGTWALSKPGFLFRLEVECRDGSRHVVASDAGWQSHLCRAWRPGQYKRWFLRALQEEFDARRYPYGWTEPGFAAPEREWIPAMELEGSPNRPALATTQTEYAQGFRAWPPEAELRPRSIPMLREEWVGVRSLAESTGIEWLRPADDYFECRPPGAYRADRVPAATETAPGRWEVPLRPGRGAALTFEFARQFVGFPGFTIEAPEGTTVELTIQEAHEVGGPVLLDTGRDSWTRFTCREGENRFECFDFESLRWLQLHIRGEGRAVVREVGARRREYAWPHQPELSAEEPAVDRLLDAAVNTLRNSGQETFVDGMGRERQQYSGDCGHQVRAARLAFGDAKLAARYLATFSQGQLKEGPFLDCWPGYDRLARIPQRQLDLFNLGPILDHGVQFTMDCREHHLYTGSLDALREPYPRLLRFAGYLRGWIGREGDGLLPADGYGVPSVWMDYEAYKAEPGTLTTAVQKYKQCAFNLYVAGVWRASLAPLCRLFGDEAMAADMERAADGLVAAAVEKFWCPERRLFVNNLPWLAEEKAPRLCDRSLATSVVFGQCPGGETVPAIRALADCPPEMGLSYPANAGWRLWALARGGRVDAVVRELRGRWASMASIALNGTIAEHWRPIPDTGSQWSHCAVAPLYIAYDVLAGLRPLEPGFRRVEVRPRLADLAGIDFTARVPQGPLRVAAGKAGADGAREVRISLPAGCEGVLVVPEGNETGLESLPAAGPGLSHYLLPAGREHRLNLRLP